MYSHHWTRVAQLVGIATLLVVVCSSTVRADNPRLNVDSTKMSLHPGDTLGILTSNQPGHLKPGGGLFLTWNKDPLSILDSAGDRVYGVVRNQLVADLYVSLGLSDYLDIAIGLPVFLHSGGDTPPLDTQTGLPMFGHDRVSGASMGDLRLGLKVSFFGNKRKAGFGLALAEDLTFQTATPRHFNGDRILTSTTTLVADYQRRGWNVAVNLGYRLRPNVSVAGYVIGDEILVGAGLVIPFICSKLEGLATLQYRTGVEKNVGDEYNQSLDLMAGLRGRLGPVVLMASAGGGTLRGFGSPAARVSFGVAYEPPTIDRGCTRDRDGDGIPDDEDDCPDDPGPVETKGCPDRDGDGVPDRIDRCPDVPGVAIFDGCPDSDGDGIPDDVDRCPKVPGPRKFDGCPDRDGDGIPDIDDACPDVPGLAEFKGCPDQDKDGIPDHKDKCPTVWGPPELDGCPPPEPPRVKVTEEKIEILEIVYFETDKALIKPVSFPLLDDVAKVLKDRPNIRKVRIEGHTDSTGTKQRNMVLGQERADAVMDYLVTAGVEAERLTAQGFGDTVPVADNNTAEGRSRNRRVEFMIVEK
jgi:outer membrane protein OmpA-like peptidoglycan-associated protein